MDDADETDGNTSGTSYLPEEMKEQVAKQLDPAALKDLRLSPEWDTHATKALFRNIELYPTASSVSDTAQILASPKLKIFVRTIKFNTLSEPPYNIPLDEGSYGIGVRPLDVSPSQDMGRSAARSNTIENVPPSQHSGQSSAAGNAIDLVTEKLGVILDRLVASLKEPEQIFYGISVKSVQCHLKEKSTVETDFQTTLAQVNAIEAYIYTRKEPLDLYEPDDEAQSFEDHRRRAFFKTALAKFILCPFATNLSELKLYSDKFWGMQPCCDLRDLHLPVIKRLTFGKLLVFANWQLDFLVGLETLEDLVLDGCPVLFGGIDQILWPHPQHLVLRPKITTNRQEDITFQHTGRWDQWFRRFKDDLPKLRRFSLGDGGLSLIRYCVYDGYYVLVPEMEDGDLKWREDEGVLISDQNVPDYPFLSDVPDRRAFDELMEVVDWRRRWLERHLSRERGAMRPLQGWSVIG